MMYQEGPPETQGRNWAVGADSAESCLLLTTLSMARHQTSIKNLSSPYFFPMLEMFQMYKGEKKIAQLTYILSGMWFWVQCELHLTLTQQFLCSSKDRQSITRPPAIC